jgi:hypothetical protein
MAFFGCIYSSKTYNGGNPAVGGTHPAVGGTRSGRRHFFNKKAIQMDGLFWFLANSSTPGYNMSSPSLCKKLYSIK